MTCIVAVKDEKTGGIFIGADCAGTRGYHSTLREDKKIFANGGINFGVCASYRCRDILQYMLTVPDCPKGMEDYKYLVSVLVPEIISCFKENDYVEIKDNVGGTKSHVIVIFNGNIYQIEPDFHVGKKQLNYDVCGHGEEYALGSLYSTQNQKVASKERVRMALESAACFDATVRGPFNIQSI